MYSVSRKVINILLSVSSWLKLTVASSACCPLCLDGHFGHPVCLDG